MAGNAKKEVDLTKVVFNPSKSFTFQPIAKKQQASLDITNNTDSAVFVKFKNTNPQVFSTHPPKCMLQPLEKVNFKCRFIGSPKEKCKKNDRFSVVLFAVPKNVNQEKFKDFEHLAKSTMKHQIRVIFPGVNDEKEKAQPTANDDDEDNKDRQGRMRTKSKSEPPAPPGKMPIVMMFIRKEGESISDEEDGPSPASDGAPSDDMRTTRPAGLFNGQVASNEAAAAPGAPIADELRTTRPAGAFTGQVASAGGAPGAPVEPKSAGMLTTRPAGAFTGQVGQVGQAAAPGAPVDPKSAGLMTTRNAGAFNGQLTSNGGSSENPELKTTKQAGSYENPQQKNK